VFPAPGDGRDLPKRPEDPVRRPTLLGMTAPAPGPQSALLASAVESLAFQVNQDTVLQARAALLGEAQRLKDEIRLSSIDQGIGLCGGDPVSSDAASAFSERIDGLLLRCSRYTDELEQAANALTDTAREYGFTEDDIRHSFGG
jgi:hypothetical protein